MNLKKMAALTAMTLAVIAVASSATLAANTYKVGNATSGACPHTFLTIQAAVDVAAPGDTISVCQGTYDERVKVTTPDLTIIGAGMSLTTIKPSTPSAPDGGNTTSLFSGGKIDAIVLVDGVSGVTIEGVTVDGQSSHPNGCSPTFVGVFYRAASGMLSDSRVTNIIDPSNPGCQGYLAVFVQSGNGGPNLNSTVVIDGNTVDNYGKNGITANEAGSSVTVSNNTVTGRGAVGTGDAAQNGVQLGFGAHGKVTNNSISDHNYTPADTVACGILAVNGGGAIGQTKTNIFTGNEVNVCTAGNGPSANSPFNRN